MKRTLLAVLMLSAVVFTGCNGGLPHCDVEQLNINDYGQLYWEWKDVSNPNWEPAALEDKVAGLVLEYQALNRRALGYVCWDMAAELWQIFADNDIVSIMAVGKTETESWGVSRLVLSHVWLIVLDRDWTAIVVEYDKVRLPGGARHGQLLTGYLYDSPQALETEYPELFWDGTSVPFS